MSKLIVTSITYPRLHESIVSPLVLKLEMPSSRNFSFLAQHWNEFKTIKFLIKYCLFKTDNISDKCFIIFQHLLINIYYGYKPVRGLRRDRGKGYNTS